MELLLWFLSQQIASVLLFRCLCYSCFRLFQTIPQTTWMCSNCYPIRLNNILSLFLSEFYKENLWEFIILDFIASLHFTQLPILSILNVQTTLRKFYHIFQTSHITFISRSAQRETTFKLKFTLIYFSKLRNRKRLFTTLALKNLRN